MPTLSVRDGGVWKPATVFVRDAGVWKSTAVSVRSGGVWNGAGGGSGFSCEAVPTTLFIPSTSEDFITSDPTMVTPSGGTGPYTYAWTLVSGDEEIVVNSPTVATTTFTASNSYDPLSAIYQCTVTDSLGATATALVSVDTHGFP